MNTRVTPARPHFLDELRRLVAQGVDLDDQLDRDAFALAQLDDPVEDRFPVLVAGEIVVGDEERGDSLGEVAAQDALDVVGRAVARLAALDVDDGAERALERAAAAAVEARIVVEIAMNHLGRQDRDGRVLEPRQIVHVIVEWLEIPGMGVPEHLVHAAFRLAGEDRDAEILGLPDLRRNLRQHGQAAADMEAADAHLDVGGAQAPGNIQGARILVRLDPDHADQAFAAGGSDLPGDPVGMDPGVGLVDDGDIDVNVRTEHAPLHAVVDDAIDHGHGVGGNLRPDPLDDIAIVVVMRRLDQIDAERLPVAGVGPCL
jgi:hypothetical protein